MKIILVDNDLEAIHRLIKHWLSLSNEAQGVNNMHLEWLHYALELHFRGVDMKLGRKR